MPAGQERTVANTGPSAGYPSARGPHRYFSRSFAAICWHQPGDGHGGDPSPLCRVYPPALWFFIPHSSPNEIAALMPLEQEVPSTCSEVLMFLQCWMCPGNWEMFSWLTYVLWALINTIISGRNYEGLTDGKKKRNKYIFHGWKYTRGWEELYRCFPEWEF